jgi:hypothetical protein
MFLIMQSNTYKTKPKVSFGPHIPTSDVIFQFGELTSRYIWHRQYHQIKIWHVAQNPAERPAVRNR